MTIKGGDLSQLRVTLFGNFSIAFEDNAMDCFHVHKVQEMFCYLLLHRSRACARESLAELLWCDAEPKLSRNYLRKALWQLQLTLKEVTGSNSWLLQSSADHVQFNPEADYWLDTAVFEDVYNRYRGLQGQQLQPEQARELETAVALYQGDLLEGWYQEWCLFERERLQQMLILMLIKLMGYCEISGEYEKGVAYGSQVLRYDQAQERVHCALMRLHYLNGDRMEAIHQYGRCKMTLDKELGVAPSEQTIALFQQIRQEQPICIPTVLSNYNSLPTTPPLSEILNRLKQFQHNLTAAQHQLQLDIDTVEKYLPSQDKLEHF